MADPAGLPTLDDLLKAVRTPQARLDLIQMALGAGWTVPDERLEELLKHLESSEKGIGRAASLALQLGRQERALDLYQKAGMRREYAELAERLGKDGLALRAYQELGDHEKSIMLAQKLGQHDLARKLAYQQADSLISSRKFFEALKLAYSLDDRTLVYRVYEAQDTELGYGTAAYAARDFGDAAKQREFLEKAIAKLEQSSREDRYLHAAWYAEQLGDAERELRFYQLHEMLNPPPAPKEGKPGHLLASALEACQAGAGTPRYPRSWYAGILASCKDCRPAGAGNAAEREILSHLVQMGLTVIEDHDGQQHYRLTDPGQKALDDLQE
jgi:tetratricopeptide (TPR) repeat protein